jgi:CRP/FNR family cyclic AMP-dependent transcriptional regulator
VENDELQTRLAKIDLFEGLSKRGLKQLINSGRLTEHQDGHEVIAQGSGPVGFHMIVEGKARVVVADTPRRTLGVGEYFGEISVIDGKPRSASVVAQGPLRTFLIHPHVFKAALDEHPEFARALLVLLCARLREADKRTG